MSHFSGTQQDDTPTIQKVSKPHAHGNLLKQKLIDLFVSKKQDDAKELQAIPESPIYLFERDETTGVKWEPISDKRLRDILDQSDIPILIVFYSSKVLLSYYELSNEQSKRCDGIFNILEKLEFVPDKVKLVKFDIEKSNLDTLGISHFPTIKLYRELESKKKYPVEYFDDPLEESNYVQFLKEEGVIGL
jgi:hypothetical protein